MAINGKTFNFVFWIIIISITAVIPPSLYSTNEFIKELKMSENENEISVYPSVFPLSYDEEKQIESELKSLSLREKCAQMVMPWVLGNFMSESSREYKRIASLVKDSKVGGIIFFKGDVQNEADIINKMQALADVPLLVASDFERGLGMRLSDGTEFPYNMALGAAGEAELAFNMGKAVAAEMRALGVHQNYAPVADVNNNPDNPIINIRAFSEDKDVVAQFTSAFVAGTNSGRVLSTVKHFPGHGNTKIDSHQDLPVIEVNGMDLTSNELVPFVEAIRAGVHSVMVGHLAVPSLEPEEGLPATLSHKIVTGLLAEKLGFQGLIVTDAMNMSAITNYYSVAEATVLAVKAGNDLILMPPDEDVAIRAIYEAAVNGEIAEERINRSVRKILAAKKWLKINENRYSNRAELSRVIKQEAHIKLAMEIAEKSVTLVKNEKNIIPIDPAKVHKTVSIIITDGVGGESTRIFSSAVDDKFGYVKKLILTKRSTKKEYDAALKAAREADLILLPSFIRVKAYQGTVKLSEGHTDFIKKVLKLKAPSVIISFGNPYLLALFPQANTYLCAYGDPEVSQKAVAGAITGEFSIRGRLPVTIPETPYKIGDGIRMMSSELTAAGEDIKAVYDFTEAEKMMNRAVAEKVFPGGMLLISKGGRIVYEKGFGRQTYDAGSPEISGETIFDLASVSKVVGTTTAAMLLYDEGKLNLDRNVKDYLPEFGNNGKEIITVRNLLMHNSGLIAYRNYLNLYKSKGEAIKSIMEEKLQYPVGSKSVYSDLNMIVLQQIIEKLTGKRLDVYLKEEVFEPLKMHRTMYNPPVELYYYCPPTSVRDEGKKRNKGMVHDGNAFLLDGVAGHAGLFSTAGDLAVFMQMMMQYGRYGSNQIIKSSTVNEWTMRQGDGSSRGLGWDTKSSGSSQAGSLLSGTTFGHTGYTGTSVWGDRVNDVFIILLTNRVYPDENNNAIREFRPQIHDEIVKAVNKAEIQ